MYLVKIWKNKNKDKKQEHEHEETMRKRGKVRMRVGSRKNHNKGYSEQNVKETYNQPTLLTTSHGVKERESTDFQAEYVL